MTKPRLPYVIRRHFDSSVFQGRNKKRSYFEGWYIKQVSDDGLFYFALIPGMALDAHSKGQAFIQLIAGHSDQTEYLNYPIEDFKFDRYAFDGYIEGNHFSKSGLDVDLTKKGVDFSARLRFIYPEIASTLWTKRGLLNWYSWVYGMQCYHILISPFHYVQGKVEAYGKTYTFDKGHGYIEKDYGKSFPNDWVWVQCNNFEDEAVSVMFSAGEVLWSGMRFGGFICSLICKGKSYVFSTYTFSRILEYNVKEETVSIRIKSINYELYLEASGTKGGLLIAPDNGDMRRKIHETIRAEVYILFKKRNGEIIYEGSGKQAGFEMEGNPQKLFKKGLQAK